MSSDQRAVLDDKTEAELDARIGRKLPAGDIGGKTIPADVTPADLARAAFVAGLIHGNLRQTGWTVHSADPSAGSCTIGLAAIFGPGFVADITVRVREATPEQLAGGPL